MISGIGKGGSIVPLVQVDISLLADQVRVSATDTLDLGQGVHDLLFTIDIGIEETQLEKQSFSEYGPGRRRALIQHIPLAATCNSDPASQFHRSKQNQRRLSQFPE